MSKERLQHLAGMEPQILAENIRGLDVAAVKDIVYDAINELVRHQKVNVSVHAVDVVVNKAGERYQREIEQQGSPEVDPAKAARLRFKASETRPHYAAKSPYRR